MKRRAVPAGKTPLPVCPGCGNVDTRPFQPLAPVCAAPGSDADVIHRRLRRGLCLAGDLTSGDGFSREQTQEERDYFLGLTVEIDLNLWLDVFRPWERDIGRHFVFGEGWA